MNITITLENAVAEDFADDCFQWIIHSSNVHYGFSRDGYSVRFEGITEEEYSNIRSYAMYLGAPVITLR